MTTRTTPIDDGSWRPTTTGPRRPDQRPEALGLRGMVASSHPVAAHVGLTVMARGGNAFDAAVAIAAAEGVLLPMMCGLGGDAFVVLYDAKRGELVGLNGSGVAGTGATPEYYKSRGHRTMPLEGIHSVGVPGAVGVYETLWKRWGSMPWADLWGPAIDLADHGVVITDWVGRRIAERAEALARFPHSAGQFLPGGRPPAPGDRWTAPDLAKSLRAVAAGGADVLYRGELGDRVLGFLRREGALFEAEDFARQARETFVYTPISTTYRGLAVHQTAPVSQGLLHLSQLNLVEGFDLAGLSPVGPDRLHLLIEAKKLAFADRNQHAGDPAFVRWPLDELIGKDHASRRRAEIDPTRAQAPRVPQLAEAGADTTYFAVADEAGNAVSFIHSLSAAFGSGVVAGDTGITLNNRVGRGFSLDEGHPNVLAPGKRTMHTLNAYLVTKNGRPWLIGGTPGGDQQTQWNTQVVTNLVDHGMTLQDAVDAPRWFSFPGTDPANLPLPSVVRVEDRIPEPTRRELERRGHVLETLPAWSGGGSVQLVQVDQERGVLRGASDPRGGGLALGR